MHQVCTSYLSISELLIHVLGNATFFLFKHEKCKNKQTKTPKKPHQKKKGKKKPRKLAKQQATCSWVVSTSN